MMIQFLGTYSRIPVAHREAIGLEIQTNSGKDDLKNVRWSVQETGDTFSLSAEAENLSAEHTGDAFLLQLMDKLGVRNFGYEGSLFDNIHELDADSVDAILGRD